MVLLVAKKAQLLLKQANSSKIYQKNGSHHQKERDFVRDSITLSGIIAQIALCVQCGSDAVFPSISAINGSPKHILSITTYDNVKRTNSLRSMESKGGRTDNFTEKISNRNHPQEHWKIWRMNSSRSMESKGDRMDNSTQKTSRRHNLQNHNGTH